MFFVCTCGFLCVFLHTYVYIYIYTYIYIYMHDCRSIFGRKHKLIVIAIAIAIVTVIVILLMRMYMYVCMYDIQSSSGCRRLAGTCARVEPARTLKGIRRHS